MFKLLLLIVCLLLVISGCHSFKGEEIRYTQQPSSKVGEEMGLWLDVGFSDLEVVQIERGIEQWNHVLNGNLRIVVLGRHNLEMELVDRVLVSSSHERLVMKVPETSPIIPFMDESGALTITIAWCDRISGHLMYFVSGRVGLGDMEPVFLHEMGHMLGLGHMEGKLMYPNYKKSHYLCIDKLAAEGVARVHGWSPLSMNYCLREP